MKKLVFAAIAMMVMVSASNSFATKSATSMKGYNTALADTTDTTKTEPVEDTTKTEPAKEGALDLSLFIANDTVVVDSTATDSTETPATPATPAKPETV
ncbi:hypothetical protein [Prevotella sp.]|uniref:hypothetical protein n=1 Tax=Prevotella sp. TaxID=59823 RepID=UPI00307BDAB9